MKSNTVFWLLAIIGLGLTIIPAILVFTGTITLELHRWLMALGALLWFISSPFAMKKIS